MLSIKTKDNINWNYEIEGEGRPLAFIHGWGVDMRTWRQQSKIFSNSYKTFAVDLPGHGNTDWQAITLEQIARDLNEIFKELNLGTLSIVASSLGGLVALKIIELFPEKVNRLVMVGSQAKFTKSEDYPFGLEERQIRQLEKQLERSYPSRVHIFFRSLFTIEERESRRFKWIQTFRKAADVPKKEALMYLLELLVKEDLRDVLYGIKFPLQFIYGSRDYICSDKLHAYLKEKFPNARFCRFENCGHFPFLSKPHEFNEALGNFLTTTN